MMAPALAAAKSALHFSFRIGFRFIEYARVSGFGFRVSYGIIEVRAYCRYGIIEV